MFSKRVPAKAAAITVVLIVGVGTATAAASGSLGDGATKSVASTHSAAPDTTDSPSTSPASTSAAPNTPAPTVTSGTSQRQGNGPNMHALPGLCRAQIASAGHPNAHSVVPTIDCSGVTPAGPASSSSAPSDQTDHSESNDGQGGAAPGVGAQGNAHGRH